MGEKFNSRTPLSWPEALVVSLCIVLLSKVGMRYLDIKEKQLEK